VTDSVMGGAKKSDNKHGPSREVAFARFFPSLDSGGVMIDGKAHWIPEQDVQTLRAIVKQMLSETNRDKLRILVERLKRIVATRVSKV